MITSLGTTLVVTAIGAYALVKVLQSKIEAMETIINKLQENDKEQIKEISKLEADVKSLYTEHSLTVKYLDEFRKESKEESRNVREVLNKNTMAIVSLEALLERIEKKLN